VERFTRLPSVACAAIIWQISADIPHSSAKEITIIKHEFNRGKGSAVQTGLENARGDMFIVQDADLELSPDEIPRMIDILVSKELEMVNGSRFIDDFFTRTYFPGRIFDRNFHYF